MAGPDAAFDFGQEIVVVHSGYFFGSDRFAELDLNRAGQWQQVAARPCLIRAVDGHGVGIGLGTHTPPVLGWG